MRWILVALIVTPGLWLLWRHLAKSEPRLHFENVTVLAQKRTAWATGDAETERRRKAFSHEQEIA